VRESCKTQIKLAQINLVSLVRRAIPRSTRQRFPCGVTAGRSLRTQTTRSVTGADQPRPLTKALRAPSRNSTGRTKLCGGPAYWIPSRLASTSAHADCDCHSVPESSKFHQADSTACATPQPRIRSFSKPSSWCNTSTRRLCTWESVYRRGSGLRSSAPTSYAASPARPFGSIASQGRRRAAKILK
jgi:hypothetical protein